MRNAPVFYTLAQVRFNPVALITQFVPKIQDKLRRAGYPDFRTELQHQIELVQLSEKPSVQTAQKTRWQFLSSKVSEGYLLDESSISYHTSSYDVFETFLEKVTTGLSLVHEVAQLAYTERIGLRYLDAIIPQTGESLGDYLSQSVLGLHQGLQGSLVHCFAETFTKNLDGNLVSRVVIREGAITLPPDLQPATLKTEERFSNLKGLHAILDNDHFSAERVDFDISKIRLKFEGMHEKIDEAFRATVTPFAIKQWK